MGGVRIIIITLVYLLVGWHCRNRLKRKSWKFAFLNLVGNGNEQCCLETEVTVYGRELWKDPICQLYMFPSTTLSLERSSFVRLPMRHPGHRMGISQGTPLAVASQRVLLAGSEQVVISYRRSELQNNTMADTRDCHGGQAVWQAPMGLPQWTSKSAEEEFSGVVVPRCWWDTTPLNWTLNMTDFVCRNLWCQDVWIVCVCVWMTVYYFF